jgi:hypothetical protein
LLETGIPALELPGTFSTGAKSLFYILLPPVLLHLLVFHLVLFEYLELIFGVVGVARVFVHSI